MKEEFLEKLEALFKEYNAKISVGGIYSSSSPIWLNIEFYSGEGKLWDKVNIGSEF